MPLRQAATLNQSPDTNRGSPPPPAAVRTTAPGRWPHSRQRISVITAATRITTLPIAPARNVAGISSSVDHCRPADRLEPHLVAEQPAVVNQAVHELVVACSIPLVLAIVFVIMEIAHIDLQRVSLGALIIALGLLVDDAMITVESMVTKLEQGWDKARAATFAYTSTAFPMLTGTLVTVAGFVPIGFAC